MLQKYIILCLIFQLIVEINCQAFKPMQRELHTATFINNKLYISGGSSSNEFFYLDFSGPFSTQQISWQVLSNTNTVPVHFGSTAVEGGAENDTLFLYGGSSDNVATPLVYTFNPQTNVWNTPTITGTNTIRKLESTGIIDNSGKMYIWGGFSTKAENNMLILDTVNLNWGLGSIAGAPIPAAGYGAVLLPNNNIIY